MRLGIFLLANICFGQSEPHLCTMTFRVVNVAGKSVAHSVKSFKDEKGNDFAGSFKGLRGRVPCQLRYYDFVLTRDGITARLGDISGKAWADDPTNYLTLVTNPNARFNADGTNGGEPSYSYPPGYVWNGRIIPLPTGHLSVRLRSAVSQFDTEAEVGPDGTFRFYEHFWEGAYFIYVMNDEGQILLMAPLTITKTSLTDTLELNLPKDPPAPIVVR